MGLQNTQQQQQSDALPCWKSILLAVDSSDHSNRGVLEAVALAKNYGSRITAAHVYAAKLHDLRFRQMEGGLPEQFREEDELERQRDVHDDLISKGLSIITDSYLDQVEKQTEHSDIDVQRCSLEGKNYRQLVNESNNGQYDLLVMGALGLGAVQGSRLGTVAQRVSRRSQIDTLVIKQPADSITAGPIVVAIDGSTKSYGGLLSAFSLAQQWQVPIKVVSAFDPYYHYVAFNRIAGVLSEEAGQVFRFQEQEKLHEEIIDSGLAKIYQGHLSVAQAIASDYNMEIETVLLDGKPHEVINRYLKQVKPSLLVMGITGIHADAELDIGGNTEYLLSDAECSVLLSHREHKPQIDRLAAVSTSWTTEAEARMKNVPSFVRPMAKMAILRYAQEHGHTVITASIVEEATAQLMPGHAEQAMEEIVDAYDKGKLKRKPEQLTIRWSEQATMLLLTIKDLSLRGNISQRAEKYARINKSEQVEAEHIRVFIDDTVTTAAFNPGAEITRQPTKMASTIHWQAAALARLMRVPEGFMRDSSKQRIEDYAAEHNISEISLAVAEQGLAEARAAMQSSMQNGDAATSTPKGKCPFANMGKTDTDSTPASKNKPIWDEQAEKKLDAVPAGFCRDMTIKAAESMAEKSSLRQIDTAFIENVMNSFKAGSSAVEPTMPWDDEALQRIARAPDMVRGMLSQEIEGWAKRHDMNKVTAEAVDAVKQVWVDRGVFHLDPNDPRNG